MIRNYLKFHWIRAVTPTTIWKRDLLKVHRDDPVWDWQLPQIPLSRNFRGKTARMIGPASPVGLVWGRDARCGIHDKPSLRDSARHQVQAKVVNGRVKRWARHGLVRFLHCRKDGD